MTSPTRARTANDRREDPCHADRHRGTARTVREADPQPSREQLRWRGQTTERDPHATRGIAVRKYAGLRAQRIQARGIDRGEFDDPARALLRWSWRRWQDHGACDAGGVRGELRQLRALARGVRCDG